MSKLSVLDQKIADIKAKRDAAALQVRMFDQVLELLEAPIAGAAAGSERAPAVPRAARGTIQAAVLEAVTTRPQTVDELEVSTGAPRSSIRKALAAHQKAGKLDERHDGSWALKPVGGRVEALPMRDVAVRYADEPVDEETTESALAGTQD